jgi:CheY-like chemotaxis protein
MNQSDKTRILVADDEAAVCDTLVEILSGDGAEVTAVPDGHAALREALLNPFDLCILDAQMPNLDGYETCARLRATPFTHDLPVLFLAGRTDREAIDQALAAGAWDYLAKPIHPVLLRRRVANLLLLSRLARERDQMGEMVRFTGPG